MCSKLCAQIVYLSLFYVAGCSERNDFLSFVFKMYSKCVPVVISMDPGGSKCVAAIIFMGQCVQSMQLSSLPFVNVLKCCNCRHFQASMCSKCVTVIFMGPRDPEDPQGFSQAVCVSLERGAQHEAKEPEVCEGFRNRLYKSPFLKTCMASHSGA